MALVGRVTIFWVLTSFFMLFVVMKLDGTTDWLWHVVFVPMWILDVLSIVFLATFLGSLYRNGGTPYRVNDFHVSKKRMIWLIVLFVLKIIFLLILCSKLDGFITASYVYVFMPLWVILLMLAVDCYIATWKEGRSYQNR